MTNFYQILEIEKSATQDVIKKAYRKLSLKWHPDKWASKSESEKKQAEEKFKEISRAYQILSDSTTRNLYDIYGEEFANPSPNDNSSSAADEIKRKFAEAEAKKSEIERQMLTVQIQSYSIMLIIDEFLDHLQIGENDLDSILWTPYSNWKEKIRNLSFEEVDKFREEMIKNIREVGKDQRSNSIKNDAIKRLEDELFEREINAEELEPNNRDYKKAINNAGETAEEILAVEERIERDIIRKAKKKSESIDVREEHVNMNGHKYRYFPWKG